MKRVVIGEEKEYVRRLSDYLIRHLPAEIRVYGFTTVDNLLDYGEEADIYLLGTEFYEELLIHDSSFSQKEILILSDTDGQGDICKWSSPAKLVEFLTDRLSLYVRQNRREDRQTRLVLLYAPYSGISLRDRAFSRMERGDIYLGFEDMGEAYPDTESREDGRMDTGELCYYIHLRDEDILAKLRKMLRKDDRGSYLDSPRWYFDFLGLGEEDYRWFFEKLRCQSAYGKVYVGVGNAVIPSMEFFQIFDKLLLYDLPRQHKIHSFCGLLKDTIAEEAYMSADSIEIVSR